MPRVSVIMPTYNAEKYLKETISDILSQTFEDFEFLIINEFGSLDRTVEIAKSFNDPRIKIIQNSKKEGMSNSLNIGIREAKGEYLARVDADDRYEKNRFEEQVKFLDENPDISILGSLYDVFGDEELIKKWIFDKDKEDEFVKNSLPLTHDEIKASMLLGCPICHPTIMIRKKDLIKNNLFYAPGVVSEDCELWARACHLVKFAILPNVLCHYRFSGENGTFQKVAEGMAFVKKIYAEQMEKHLQIERDKYNLLSFANNPVAHLQNSNALLEEIWRQNEKLKVYDPEALMKTFQRYWKITYLRCHNLENDLSEVAKDKKIYLYGAGIFAEELLDKYDFSKFNVLGFLDINKKKVGQSLRGYKIFHRDSISELKPDIIILTVQETFYIYYDLVASVLSQELNIMVIPNFIDIIKSKDIYEKSMFFPKE